MTAESESRFMRLLFVWLLLLSATPELHPTTGHGLKLQSVSVCGSGHRVWRMTNLTADWNHFHRKFDHDTSFCGF